MDPFKKFGIEKVSPSVINLFHDDPALWATQYLFKIWDDRSPVAERGLAVEKALAYAALNPGVPIEDAIELGDTVFMTAIAEHQEKGHYPGPADEVQKEIDETRAAIKPLIAAMIPTVRTWGKPIQIQGKVTVYFDGIPIPVEGYYDWTFASGGGTVRDCKISGRTPSKPSERNARQMSIYAKGTKLKPILDYCTPLKKGINFSAMPVEDVEFRLKECHRVLMQMQALLDAASNPDHLCRLLNPNFDLFLWGDKTKAFALKKWGYE